MESLYLCAHLYWHGFDGWSFIIKLNQLLLPVTFLGNEMNEIWMRHIPNSLHINCGKLRNFTLYLKSACLETFFKNEPSKHKSYPCPLSEGDDEDPGNEKAYKLPSCLPIKADGHGDKALLPCTCQQQLSLGDKAIWCSSASSLDSKPLSTPQSCRRRIEWGQTAQRWISCASSSLFRASFRNA